jgi:hypothetical protein
VINQRELDDTHTHSKCHSLQVASDAHSKHAILYKLSDTVTMSVKSSALSVNLLPRAPSN